MQAVQVAPEALSERARRPVLHVVPAVDERTLESHIGRAAVRGAGVGFVVFGVLATCVALLFGIELGAALGMGAFVGFWGGFGFGGLEGAVLSLRRRGWD